MKNIKQTTGAKGFLLLLVIFFVCVLFSISRSEDTKTPPAKDPNVQQQLKVKITSPKPGEILKKKIQILWEVETSCTSLNEEKKAAQTGTTQKEKYVTQYFVDYQLVGENTTDDPPFELDTTLFKNGVHTITINVADEHPHAASYGVKVKFKN